MSVAADAAQPTPEERLWAADPTTPAIVLAKLARFPELQPLVREHPAAYPELVAWIDAQGGAASTTAGGSRSSRRPLAIAVGVAAVALAGAGVTLGVMQPWASVAGTAAPRPGDTVEGPAASDPTHSPTPTPTPTPVAVVPIAGTVVVTAGANVRAEPSTSAAKIGAYGNGATVEITCYVRGDTITDALGTTDVWYAVDGGYISAAILQASDPDAVTLCDE